jgi:hypothetical protein
MTCGLICCPKCNGLNTKKVLLSNYRRCKDCKYQADCKEFLVFLPASLELPVQESISPGIDDETGESNE